ncbi:hypothetical protein J6590_077718 [Homalodisca vitripennis]|nr:hypothetical protein J6590_077718 [Homalodisca vitripennis]
MTSLAAGMLPLRDPVLASSLHQRSLLVVRKSPLNHQVCQKSEEDKNREVKRPSRKEEREVVGDIGGTERSIIKRD